MKSLSSWGTESRSDGKTLRVLGSPNLKMFGKNVVQVEFVEGDDDEGFVKKVKEQFEDYSNTSVCILDNFDGNSMKVAELLFKNGFKEAYAIRGGARGNNGWLEIQETLLPPSVHIYLKTKLKNPSEANNNGVIEQESEVKSQPNTIHVAVSKYETTSISNSIQASIMKMRLPCTNC